MTYEMEKQYQANQAKPKKRVPLWLAITLGVGALVIGVLAGAATSGGAESAAPTPAPTVTVTTEVPAAVETGTCRDVAAELYDMLQTTTDEVLIPQNGVVQAMVGMLQNGIDIATVEQSTATMQEVTDAASDLTDRANALRSDYQRCVNP